MFLASHSYGPFDYLRVPYDLDPSAFPDGSPGLGRLRSADEGRGASLLWVRSTPRSGSRAGVFEVAGCRVAGTVSAGAPPQLPHRGAWHPRWAVTGQDGRQLSAVWCHDHGDVWLPFDPGAVMRCLWSEEYRRLGSRQRLRAALRHVAVRAYYGVRPALPRRTQLLLRRRLAAASEPAFPTWPLHTGLHDLYEWLLALAADLAGRPVPWIAPWPEPATWAFVLTHDVETAQGVEDIDLLRGPERDGGYRSGWNFVPERYATPPEVLQQLRGDDCEVGVHGLRHDGRDLASARVLARRLPAMRAAADRWGATGFRAPATQRSWHLMPRLGFDHDSSYTDTDPYEPQPGGCCTFLPFFIDGLVELPITLPQDHTVFQILGHRSAALWLDKAQELRRRGGMVLVLSHPDYAHGDALRAWHELLAEFRSDSTMWQALPREVAQWWRQRASSRLVEDEDGWVVTGPGAGRARVAFSSASHGSVA